MNKYTLTFKSPEFEELYRQSQHPLVYQNFKQLGICAIIFGTIVAFNNIINCFYIKSIMFFSFNIIGTITIILGKKYTCVVNYTNFVLSLTTTLILYFQELNNKDTMGTDSHPLAAFQSGFNSGLLLLLFLGGTKYYLKKLSIVINTILIFVFYMKADSNFYEITRYLIIILAFGLDRLIYQLEYGKRQYFLLSQQNSQWQKGLEDALDLPVFQTTYNCQKEQLNLIKTNYEAKICQLKIQSADDFKHFSRVFLIEKIIQNQQQSEKNKDILQVMLNLVQKKKKELMTLENFIFLMIQKPKRLKKICKLRLLDNIYHTNFTLLGNVQSQQLYVKLFCIYDDDPVIIIMLLKNEKVENNYIQSANLKTKDYLLKKLLFSKIDCQRSCLSLLKQRLDGKKSLILLQYFQYIEYNNCLNISCFLNKIQRQGSNRVIQISILLSRIESILQPILRYKKIRLMCILNNQCDQIYSCEWKLYQILFNIILNGIKYSRTQGFILIKYKIKKDKALQLYTIQFKIEDQAIGMTQKQVDKLPIINPQYLREYYINQQNKHFKLGLTISSYLLSQIGPSPQIKIKHKDNKKQTTFNIYSDISQLISQNLISQLKFSPQIKIVDQIRNRK